MLSPRINDSQIEFVGQFVATAMEKRFPGCKNLRCETRSDMVHKRCMIVMSVDTASGLSSAITQISHQEIHSLDSGAIVALCQQRINQALDELEQVVAAGLSDEVSDAISG